MGRKLGTGAFGEIYIGVHISTGEAVAVKLEPRKIAHPQLLEESRVYRVLADAEGIPEVKWTGTEGDYNIMVMDLLGSSLESLFSSAGKHFSMKTILMLADQMILRIEYVHSRSIIHRDIKPDNFLMGIGKKSRITHLIDFGLAKRFRDPRSGLHIPYREGKNLTGTARFASVNTHLGIEQSRRDDLESLGYILIYFARGALPWQGIKALSRREKYDKLADKKMATPVEELCKGCPPEFVTYLNYVRCLRFEDKPDYPYLRRLFHDLFVKEKHEMDFIFDWTSRTASSGAESAGETAGSAEAGGSRKKKGDDRGKRDAKAEK